LSAARLEEEAGSSPARPSFLRSRLSTRLDDVAPGAGVRPHAKRGIAEAARGNGGGRGCGDGSGNRNAISTRREPTTETRAARLRVGSLP
jgi:hypothetical protein